MHLYDEHVYHILIYLVRGAKLCKESLLDTMCVLLSVNMHN